MHEYIKRSDAVNEINRGDLLVGNCAAWAKEIIWRCPYADVKEVKYARWHENIRYFGNVRTVTYRCSGCGFGSNCTSRYCTDCGAQMYGG